MVLCERVRFIYFLCECFAILILVSTSAAKLIILVKVIAQEILEELYFFLRVILSGNFYTSRIGVLIIQFRYTAIGVASFANRNIKKCGKWPGGFARITSELVSWIRSATGRCLEIMDLL